MRPECSHVVQHNWHIRSELLHWAVTAWIRQRAIDRLLGEPRYRSFSTTVKSFSIPGWGHSRRGRGAAALLPLQIWATYIFWAARAVWAKQILKEVYMYVCMLLLCFFFSEDRYLNRYFLFEIEVSTVKPVQFTRESGCLPHDEFLVIFERDHSLTYMYVFAIVLLLGTVLHCTR